MASLARAAAAALPSLRARHLGSGSGRLPLAALSGRGAAVLAVRRDGTGRGGVLATAEFKVSSSYGARSGLDLSRVRLGSWSCITAVLDHLGAAGSLFKSRSAWVGLAVLLFASLQTCSVDSYGDFFRSWHIRVPSLQTQPRPWSGKWELVGREVSV